MLKIAFIQKEGYEKLSVHFLAGALKAAGIDYQLFIYDLEEDFWGELIKYNPSFVAYSLFIGEEVFALMCLKKVKELIPHAKTLVGGPFTLVFPEIYKKTEIDFVFRGDGEYTLPLFIKKMESSESVKEIAGICFVDEHGNEYMNEELRLVDINGLQKPDRDLYYKYDSLRNKSTKIFIAGRGCPYRCKYCYNAELSGCFETGYWRQRKVHDVIDEIRYVRDTYGLQWVHFQDGTFNANKKWLRDFLETYSETDLPQFMCNGRVENIDAEIVRLLKRAGCNRITFGIQSGNPRVRRELAGRSMSNEQIIEACKLCKEYSIRVGVDIIFGWPGETLQEAMDTIKLCRKVDVETYSSNVLVFYPGLRITKYAYENGFIEKIPTLAEIHHLNLNKSLLLDRKKHILVNIDKLFYYLIKFPRLELVILLLLRFPPNKLFLLLKNIHLLMRSFRYDDSSSKFKLVLNYIVNSRKF